jgi:subtilisin-like proprotein convertase family protein
MKSNYINPRRGLCSNWRTSSFFSFLAILLCFSFNSQAQTTITGDNLGAPVGPDAGDLTESVATSSLTGTIGTDYTISNVTLDITHTWVADLDISLVAPDGTSLDLSSDNGGSGDNYTNTQFEDDGPDGDIIFGSAPFTGVFTPEDATFADAFDGVDVNGSWTLVIFDDANGDGGTLNNFQITFAPPPSCIEPANLTASNVTADEADLSWDADATAILGYQWVVMNAGDPPAIDGSQVATGSTNSGELMDTVSGLSGGTSYDAYVRSVCSIVDSSDWSDVASFITLPVCGGSFFDSGGPDGNYSLNENIITTISPDSPGDVVSVEFLSFDVEETWDGLLIYDGPDATAPLIDSGGGENYNLAPDGSWSGSGSDEFSAEGLTFISTHPTGSLTFVFVSDDLVVRAGWEATVTCGPPPTCVVPENLESSNVSATGADLSWDDVPTATLGYQWVVMPSGVEPAVDGSEVATGSTNSGELTASVSGLSSGTSYDAYVRSVCSIVDSSD